MYPQVVRMHFSAQVDAMYTYIIHRYAQITATFWSSTLPSSTSYRMFSVRTQSVRLLHIILRVAIAAKSTQQRPFRLSFVALLLRQFSWRCTENHSHTHKHITYSTSRYALAGSLSRDALGLCVFRYFYECVRQLHRKATKSKPKNVIHKRVCNVCVWFFFRSSVWE